MELFEKARDGRAAEAVLIGGEGGIGKSRLIAEWLGRVGDELRVLSGGCVELGTAGLPFAPFTAALRALVRELGSEGLYGLLPGASDLAWLVPDLGPTRSTIDRDLDRARLFERILALLEVLDHPVALIIEDVHWADRSTLDLLNFLICNQRSVGGVITVVTYRLEDLDHERRGRLAELARVATRMVLPRLSRREVTAQLRGLVGAEPSAELVREICRRSEGNPLFVEALHAGDPERVGDLFVARVGGLPERTRRAVRELSVAMSAVPFWMIDEASIRPALDAGLLIVDGDTYCFRHELIRESVYRSLLPGERAALHRRYAETIEGPPAERAHHWDRAGEPARALEDFRRAAFEAGASLAYTEQLDLLERVLALEGPGRGKTRELAVEVANLAGEHERGERLATELLIHERSARILQLRARMRRHLGRSGDIDDLREAVRLAPEGQKAPALAGLASRLMEGFGAEEAEAVAESAMEAAQVAGDDASLAIAMICLSTLKIRAGDLTGGFPRLWEAQKIARAGGHQGALMRAIHYESHLLEAFGEHEGAIAAARKGIAAAEETGLARTSGAVHCIDLVEALAVWGHWDEALEAIERGLELAPTPALRAHLLRHRAFIALARGDTLLPAMVIEENRPLASDPHELLPLIVLEIELALAQGRHDDARSIANDAVMEHDLRQASRFAWPLLVAAAEAGAGESLRDVRADLGVTGPIQRAHAVHFDAVTGSARWDDAASAWETAGNPYRTAVALTRAAHALVTSDRATSIARWVRAFELASDLRAEPLLGQIAGLARRTGASLGKPDTRSGGAFGLTPREMDVLRLVVEGFDNRRIAAELFITAKTASVHVSSIKAKLGAGSRTEAAAIARRHGLA